MAHIKLEGVPSRKVMSTRNTLSLSCEKAQFYCPPHNAVFSSSLVPQSLLIKAKGKIQFEFPQGIAVSLEYCELLFLIE